MKPSTTVVLVLLFAATITLWLLRSTGNQSDADPRTSVTQAAAESNSRSGQAPATPPRFSLLRKMGTVPSANPFQTSMGSLTPTSAHTRSTLTNLLMLTTLSDLLLVHPEASEADLLAALLDQGIPQQQARDVLLHYPRGNLSMPTLYDRARTLPELRSIEEAAERCGLPFDPSSDCILDCFRFVVGSGELLDFLGEVQRTLTSTPDAAGFATEAERLGNEMEEARQTLRAAYRERFLLRHGLTEGQSEALLNELVMLRAPSATTEHLYIPRRIPAP